MLGDLYLADGDRAKYSGDHRRRFVPLPCRPRKRPPSMRLGAKSVDIQNLARFLRLRREACLALSPMQADRHLASEIAKLRLAYGDRLTDRAVVEAFGSREGPALRRRQRRSLPSPRPLPAGLRCACSDHRRGGARRDRLRSHRRRKQYYAPTYAAAARACLFAHCSISGSETKSLLSRGNNLLARK
jgi:hypothetical protein